jgi:hypothetical protein
MISPETHADRYEEYCQICYTIFMENEMIFLTECKCVFQSHCFA